MSLTYPPFCSFMGETKKPTETPTLKRALTEDADTFEKALMKISASGRLPDGRSASNRCGDYYHLCERMISALRIAAQLCPDPSAQPSPFWRQKLDQTEAVLRDTEKLLRDTQQQLKDARQQNQAVGNDHAMRGRKIASLQQEVGARNIVASENQRLRAELQEAGRVINGLRNQLDCRGSSSNFSAFRLDAENRELRIKLRTAEERSAAQSAAATKSADEKIVSQRAVNDAIKHLMTAKLGRAPRIGEHITIDG